MPALDSPRCRGWTRLAALLAVAAVAIAATGCGSNEVNGTIPTDQADPLLADLDAVQRDADAGNCEAAAASADRFVTTVNSLPANRGSSSRTPSATRAPI